MSCIEVTCLIFLSWISILYIKYSYFSNKEITYDNNPIITKIDYEKNIICDKSIIIAYYNDTFSQNIVNNNCYKKTKRLELDYNLRRSKSLQIIPLVYLSIGHVNNTLSFYIINHEEYNCTLNQFTQILRDNSIVTYKNFFQSDLLYTFDDNYKSILRYDILENSILLKSRKFIYITELTIKNLEEFEFETKITISC